MGCKKGYEISSF